MSIVWQYRNIHPNAWQKGLQKKELLFKMWKHLDGESSMTPHPHDSADTQPKKCKTCRVDWKRCGLRLQDCTKTYPISDSELELILQTNENLPTDELEIVIRDLVVMDIRERTEHDAQVAVKERERVLGLLRPALCSFCPHRSYGPCHNTLLHCDECIKIWVDEQLRQREQP